MKLLQKCVQAGYKDVAHMRKDADLDAQCGQEDFKKRLAPPTGYSVTMSDVTQILIAIDAGEPQAPAQLLPLV